MRSATVRLIHQPLLELQANRSRQQLRSILYVCSNCRHEISVATSPLSSIASSSTNAIASVRFLSSTAYQSSQDDGPSAFTEKVRRRLWGTDKPPGLKDPYGEGFIERNLRRRRESKQQQRDEEQAVEEEMDPEFEESELRERPGVSIRAKTWDDLERIGSLIREDMPSKADYYNRFLSTRKLVTREHLSLAAHQVAVELCLMHDLGKPLADICAVIEHEKEIFLQILRCSISAPAGSGPSTSFEGWLSFPDKECKDILHFVFKQIGVRKGTDENAVTEDPVKQEDSETVEALADAAVDTELTEGFGEEPEEGIQVDSQSAFFGFADAPDARSLALPLADPITKFAFVKRFSQITGHHIPDFPLSKIHTVQQLVNYIHKTVIDPPPKKLAEVLQANQELMNLPNVKIFTERRTRMHADEEAGRKKLIDKAFAERGLFLQKNV